MLELKGKDSSRFTFATASLVVRVRPKPPPPRPTHSRAGSAIRRGVPWEVAGRCSTLGTGTRWRHLENTFAVPPLLLFGHADGLHHRKCGLICRKGGEQADERNATESSDENHGDTQCAQFS